LRSAALVRLWDDETGALVQRLASIPDLDIATVADHEAARKFRDAESLSAREPGH
jgi:hypothetical protein